MNQGVVHYALKKSAVELRDVPRPEIGPRDVLVQVAAVGVCGSDIHQAHNTHSWEVNVPVVLGHEFAGTIVEAGREVSSFAEGDRVVSETAAEVCGECVLCHSGRYNLCPQRRGFGYGTHGAMTTYVRVPSRCLHRLPDNLSFEHAALTEPSSVAYHAVCVNARVRPGDSVLVLGPGPIGLLCARMAVLSGANPVLVSGLGSDATRLEVARTLGATHAVNVQKDDLDEMTDSLTNGLGVDVVIDTAGVSASLSTALRLVRPDGQIAKVGWGPQPFADSLDPLVLKNVTLQGSFSHTYAMWEKVIHLLDTGQIPAERIIGYRGRLEDWQEAFEKMHHGDVVKSILIPAP